MNLHGGEEQDPGGGQSIDLIATIGCAGVAAVFGEQAYAALANHIPEAGVAASGLGFVALTFTGLSIASYHRFRKPPSSPVDK